MKVLEGVTCLDLHGRHLSWPIYDCARLDCSMHEQLTYQQCVMTLSGIILLHPNEWQGLPTVLVYQVWMFGTCMNKCAWCFSMTGFVLSFMWEHACTICGTYTMDGTHSSCTLSCNTLQWVDSALQSVDSTGQHIWISRRLNTEIVYSTTLSKVVFTLHLVSDSWRYLSYMTWYVV